MPEGDSNANECCTDGRVCRPHVGAIWRGRRRKRRDGKGIDETKVNKLVRELMKEFIVSW